MMSFTNGAFHAFLIAVFFCYWAVPGSARARIAVLAVASGIFYAVTAGWALALLALMAAIDHTNARLIAQSSRPAFRKGFLLFSVAIDVGTLVVFKYAQFFVAPDSPLVVLVVAPIGISFFVFQSLAYVIDVYRGGKPAESYLDYLTFATFFPTIVSGPILRAKDVLPQLRLRAPFDSGNGGRGLFLIAIGLIKKIAIADYIGANLVERVFDFPERFSSLEVLVAVYGYAVQIYADFSGYSDVAIGAALLLGINVPANFNSPYRAVDLPDFWRRWHISLSTWLRDYVFFPVTGTWPRSVFMLYAGLVITMLLAGIWHGSAWTFVVWGLLHGIGLAVGRLSTSLRKRFAWPKSQSRLRQAAGVCLTFHFVCLTWIVFRAETLERANATIRQIGTLTSLTSFAWDTSNLTLPIAILIFLGLAAHWIPDGAFSAMREGFVRLPALAQAAALFLLALGLYGVASSDVAPFIYARF